MVDHPCKARLGEVAGFLGVGGESLDVANDDAFSLPGQQTKGFEPIERPVQGRTRRAELGGELALAAADRDLRASRLVTLLLSGAQEEPGGKAPRYVETDGRHVASVAGAHH